MTDLTVDFFESIINSLTEHIAVIDSQGSIKFVNSAWVDFGIANNSRHDSATSWIGINYLNVCDASVIVGETHGSNVAKGTRQIMRGELATFYHEYPCHSDTEQRWFMMRITPLHWRDERRLIVSHQNITERKLAEEKVQALSMLDGLTNLPNRRCFDDFLEAEWRRGQRAQSPVSLAMLDVDHFKLYNDHYGHLDGDQCLKQVAAAISKVGRRPGDLAARYGGEEFAVIMGDTDHDSALKIATKLLASINRLGIPHATSPVNDTVSASIGVATLEPTPGSSPALLIKAADQALYRAKSTGRNRVA